jgi:hypothetical protein
MTSPRGGGQNPEVDWVMSGKAGDDGATEPKIGAIRRLAAPRVGEALTLDEDDALGSCIQRKTDFYFICTRIPSAVT